MTSQVVVCNSCYEVVDVASTQKIRIFDGELHVGNDYICLDCCVDDDDNEPDQFDYNYDGSSGMV